MNITTKKNWVIGGYNYYSPIKIGAGLRARYQERLMQQILQSPNSDQTIKMIGELAVATTAVAQVKKGPNLVIPESGKEENKAKELEKLLNEKYSILVKTFAVQQVYDYRLILLETLLTPGEESPSVAEIFDIADEEEIVAVENFFQGKSVTKTTEETTGSPALNTKVEEKVGPYEIAI